MQFTRKVILNVVHGKQQSVTFYDNMQIIPTKIMQTVSAGLVSAQGDKGA